MKTKAILLMAGMGERFESDLPKQFHRLFGKKIYLHTLDTFLKSRLFDEILLIVPEHHVDTIRAETPSPVRLVIGGSTRQASCLNGLLACGPDTDFVVIHDAVRPFVSLDILSANIAAVKTYAAVDTCIPSADTLVYAPNQTHIDSIPPRAHFLRGQTPQSFSYPLILKAHMAAKEAGITNSSDDCSLVLRLNHPVHVVLGDESNIKITSPLDLILAEQIGRLKKTQIPHISPISLKGKIFAITGGTGGIGMVLAELLLAEGATPLLISKTAPDYPTDLTSFAQTEQTFAAIHQQHGPLDGLINCVGLLKRQPFRTLTQEDIDLLVATNLTTILYSCRLAPIKDGGYLINLASSSYTRGRSTYALYSSAKAALVNFTQALADEHPELHIHVVVPQRTLTPMRTQNFPVEDGATLLSPDEVVAGIVGLLRQDAVTGTVLEIRK